jgi:hypothetical protein
MQIRLKLTFAPISEDFFSTKKFLKMIPLTDMSHNQHILNCRTHSKMKSFDTRYAIRTARRMADVTSLDL